MKQLITLIGALNLSVGEIVPVTSCSTDANKKENENSNDQQNNGNVQLNDGAKAQVQELNIVSMLEEGIDSEAIELA